MPRFSRARADRSRTLPLLIALAASAAGILDTVQAGANAALNKGFGQPILAALAVSAAIVTSVVLHPDGWVGFARHTADPRRGLGCALTIGRLVLVCLR
ncbi:MAG: hypothetical protein PGN25_21225 [Methylorubrum populi]